MTKTRSLLCLAALAAGASFIALAQGRQGDAGQAGATAGANWDTYGGNLASHRYSPLDQIHKDNFRNLRIAWRLKTDFLGPTPDNRFLTFPPRAGKAR
jgi:glucose dehydrogenase